MRSPETRAKISAAGRGRIVSAETRAKMSAAHTGRMNTPEAIEKVRQANIGRQLTAEHREKLRQAKLRNPVRYWQGKKRGPQSAETKAKLSATHKLKPRPPGWGMSRPAKGSKRSPETVAKMTATMRTPEMRAKMASHTFGKPCRHAKHPVFYNGRRFRSTYEVRVAAALDALGVEWTYEEHRFNLGSSTYAPDFYLPADGVFWEVKGWYGPDSQRKVETFRAMYPDVSLVVFTKECIKALECAVKKAA